VPRATTLRKRSGKRKAALKSANSSGTKKCRRIRSRVKPNTPDTMIITITTLAADRMVL